MMIVVYTKLGSSLCFKIVRQESILGPNHLFLNQETTNNNEKVSNGIMVNKQTITKEAQTINNSEAKNQKLEIIMHAEKESEIKIQQTTTETTRTDTNQPVITDEEGIEYSIADIMRTDFEHRLKINSLHHHTPINNEKYQLTNNHMIIG